jgi:hypothetical protein
MLSLVALLMVIKINMIVLILARGTVVGCLYPVKINISPMFLIIKRKLTVKGLYRNPSSLNHSSINKKVIVFSILLKVQDVELEIINTQMHRNPILLKITKNICYVVIGWIRGTPLPHNFIFKKVNLIFFSPQKVDNDWLIK